MESARLRGPVCWRCYHGSFSDADLAEAERIGRQQEIARAIRHAIEPLDGTDRQRLADLALLIETELETSGVLALLAEVERLGVEVEVVRS
jgi:hypothetical protein